MFIDEVILELIAGTGGDGCMAFRREKYVAMGGPFGGSGGKGSDIIFKADSGLKTLKGGSIQIMTMHKYKGDEFDYVFIPELTEKNLGTDFKSIKIGNNSGFFEDIKSLERNYTHKNATELKQEILHENLRLLYVAITRAKKKIFFTVSQKQNIFGRNREVEISNLFNTFLNNIF